MSAGPDHDRTDETEPIADGDGAAEPPSQGDDGAVAAQAGADVPESVPDAYEAASRPAAPDDSEGAG